jgi:hypothetical protein
LALQEETKMAVNHGMDTGIQMDFGGVIYMPILLKGDVVQGGAVVSHVEVTYDDGSAVYRLAPDALGYKHEALEATGDLRVETMKLGRMQFVRLGDLKCAERLPTEPRRLTRLRMQGDDTIVSIRGVRCKL